MAKARIKNKKKRPTSPDERHNRALAILAANPGMLEFFQGQEENRQFLKKAADGLFGSFRADQAASTTTTNRKFKSTKDWITSEAHQMKVDDEISDRITDFAKQLERRMDKAAETDRSLRRVKWRYIKNQLPAWGLWPKDKI